MPLTIEPRSLFGRCARILQCPVSPSAGVYSGGSVAVRMPLTTVASCHLDMWMRTADLRATGPLQWRLCSVLRSVVFGSTCKIRAMAGPRSGYRREVSAGQTRVEVVGRRGLENRYGG